MKLGTWLDQQNVSQREFGRRLGITQGAVSQIVRRGTNSIQRGLQIEQETGGAVPVRDVLPAASEQAGAAE